MIRVRPSKERGHADHGWLDTRHTFSFADYYDDEHMGFRSLRVINEDRVRGGRGFGTHPHRDMEIFTYVLSGAVQHRDNMGSGSVIRPGDVQAMSAGTGVLHSEFNPSPIEDAHFLQVWILPDRRGHTPSYDQKTFAPEEKRGRLRLIVSGDGRDGSLRINQDASVYASVLAGGQEAGLSLEPGRGAWVQVVSGEVAVNGEVLQEGDGAAIESEPDLHFAGRTESESEFLVFDLA